MGVAGNRFPTTFGMWIKLCAFESHHPYNLNIVESYVYKKYIIINMRSDILGREQEIREWINQNLSNAEITRKLECKVDTLKSYYKKMGINYKGNQGGKGIRAYSKRKPANEFVLSNVNNAAKRRRLIEDGVKEAKCECCGLSEWMGKPIPLELHHKDFNHYNNELSNLQILCSNCHMQAHNYNNNLRSSGATG